MKVPEKKGASDSVAQVGAGVNVETSRCLGEIIRNLFSYIFCD